MTDPAPAEAWRDGYLSGWREAGAYLAGAAAASDGPVRAALWKAYMHCDQAITETRRAFADANIPEENPR